MLATSEMSLLDFLVLAIVAFTIFPWLGEGPYVGHLQTPKAASCSLCFLANWQFSIVRLCFYLHGLYVQRSFLPVCLLLCFLLPDSDRLRFPISVGFGDGPFLSPGYEERFLDLPRSAPAHLLSLRRRSICWPWSATVSAN